MENNNTPSTPLPTMAESDRQLEQEIGSEVTVSMMQDPTTITEDGLVQGEAHAAKVVQFPGRSVEQNYYGNPNDYKPFQELPEGEGLVMTGPGDAGTEHEVKKVSADGQTLVSWSLDPEDTDQSKTVDDIASAVAATRSPDTIFTFPSRAQCARTAGEPDSPWNTPTTMESSIAQTLGENDIPGAAEQPEPTGVPLFSTEQIQEVQELVVKESAKRYKRENYIPLPGEKGLFSKVMQAIVDGLRRFPKTSAFITPATLGGILQACAPTMFVIPYVAAQIDEDVYNVHSVYSMLSEAARDHAEAMVPGANHEDPALVVLRDKLNEMIDHYAQKLITVFETLGAARYVMGASALQDSPIYHTPVIIKQINADLQGLIDRDVYSKAFHRQDVSTTFCTPPDILGVDVLQVLGHMTSQPDIGSLQLHLLTVAYGASNVRVGPEGDLEFADDIMDRVSEVLAPQRIWFAQTATWLAGVVPDKETPVAE